MSKSKKILALLLSLAMCLMITPGLSFAAAPIYVEGQFEAASDEIGFLPPVKSAAIMEEGYDQQIQQVKKALIARETSLSMPAFAVTVTDDIVIDTAGKTQEQYQNEVTAVISSIVGPLLRSFWIDAMRHTGAPTEGDYIRRNTQSVSMVYGAMPRFEGKRLVSLEVTHADYTFKHYSSAAQEAEADVLAAALLEELNLEGMTDYQKFSAIYEWICKNVVYDHENLSDPNYTLKYTAYAALKNRSAVCQGYSSLLYRLLLTEGIDCRIIPGKAGADGNLGDHAWNIVKLGDQYYNADSTWDSSYIQAGLDYAYRLRPDSVFERDHVRHSLPENDDDHESDFTSEDFYGLYPMSLMDFDPASDVVSVTGVTVQPEALELTVGETAVLTAVVTPENASDKSVSWATSNNHVASVTEGTVAALAPGSALITVVTKDGGFDGVCAVTVKAAEPTDSASSYELELQARAKVGGGASVSVTARKKNGSSGPGVLIVAAQDGDGNLSGASVKALSAEDGESSFAFSFDGAAEGHQIRAFVWDSLSSMTPLSRAALCQVEPEPEGVTAAGKFLVTDAPYARAMASGVYDRDDRSAALTAMEDVFSGGELVVEKGGEILAAEGDFDCSALLGLACQAELKLDGADARVIDIQPVDGGNTVVRLGEDKLAEDTDLSSDEYEAAANGRTVFYWKNGLTDPRPSSLELAPDVRTFVNFKDCSAEAVYGYFYKELLADDGGYVDFIDNDGDGSFDFALVSGYAFEGVVAAVETREDGALVFEGRPNAPDMPAPYSPADSSVLRLFYKDGQLIDPALIAPGDTVTALGREDGPIQIYRVSSLKAEGVGSYNAANGRVSVGGRSYAVAHSFSGDADELSGEGTFYLNADSMVSAFVPAPLQGSWGYLLSVESVEKYGKRSYSVKLMDENGLVQELAFNSMMRVYQDPGSNKSMFGISTVKGLISSASHKDALFSRLESVTAENSGKDRVIKFIADEGKLMEIAFASDCPYYMDCVDRGGVYDASARRLGGGRPFAPEAVIFAVRSGEGGFDYSDASAVAVESVGGLENGRSYDMTLYSEADEVRAALVSYDVEM